MVMVMIIIIIIMTAKQVSILVLSPSNLIVAPYFTRTISVDAISNAVIAAGDSHVFARNMSIDATRTAVIVAVGSPLFTRNILVDAIRTAVYHTVDVIRTIVIVAVDSQYFTRSVSASASRIAMIDAVDAPYFTYVFQMLELCHSYIALLIFQPTPPTTAEPLYKIVLCFYQRKVSSNL